MGLESGRALGTPDQERRGAVKLAGRKRGEAF